MSAIVTDRLIGAVMLAAAVAAFLDHVVWAGVLLAVLGVATATVPAALTRRLARKERELREGPR